MVDSWVFGYENAVSINSLHSIKWNWYHNTLYVYNLALNIYLGEIRTSNLQGTKYIFYCRQLSVG